MLNITRDILSFYSSIPAIEWLLEASSDYQRILGRLSERLPETLDQRDTTRKQETPSETTTNYKRLQANEEDLMIAANYLLYF